MGAHESQGFAIEEALSVVFLVVWNISSMSQKKVQDTPRKKATSIRTGIKDVESIFIKKRFEPKYEEFISKLNTYKPREFVLENLSVENCVENFKKILQLFIVKYIFKYLNIMEKTFFEQCFDKHDFKELNNIDVHMLYNVFKYHVQIPDTK